MEEIKLEFIEEENIIKKKYGFLPTSVWNLKYDGSYKNFEINIPKHKNYSGIKELNDYTFSHFNPAVCKRVIKYWSKKGDTILDPFMGYGMRGFVAINLGRNYIGFEISPRTFNCVKQKLNMEKLNNFKNQMKIILDNGCYLNGVKDNSIDLIFTCPPYWKVEKYENVPGQLSGCKSYNIFLEFISVCLKNCYRVLKKDKFMVWVVNDFRINRQFFPFHRDLLTLAERNRFKIHDIVINVLHNPFKMSPIPQDKVKITVKMHEYLLVFKK